VKTFPLFLFMHEFADVEEEKSKTAPLKIEGCGTRLCHKTTEKRREEKRVSDVVEEEPTLCRRRKGWGTLGVLF